MNKPWSCGAIIAGLILLIMVLVLVGVIDMSPNKTASNIVAAHRACEAQTGKPCD